MTYRDQIPVAPFVISKEVADEMYREYILTKHRNGAEAFTAALMVFLRRYGDDQVRKLQLKARAEPPTMTGMSFDSDVIVNGRLIKAGTVVKFQVPE